MRCWSRARLGARPTIDRATDAPVPRTSRLRRTMSPARLPAPPRPGSRRRLGSSSPRLATFVCVFVATAALAPPPRWRSRRPISRRAPRRVSARAIATPPTAPPPPSTPSPTPSPSRATDRRPRRRSSRTATPPARSPSPSPPSATRAWSRARVDDPKHPRYRVPDVLVDDLDRRRSKFTAATPVLAEDDPRATRATIFSVPDPDVVVEVRHAPFRVALLRGGVETTVFNARGLFAFERLGDAAAEASASGGGGMGPTRTPPPPRPRRRRFAKRSTATRTLRPNGPTAVAFDVAFPRAGHVYGIPERATSLSLRPTLEGGEDGTACVTLSEPYRMYNLDVFEYEHDSPFGLYGSIPVMLAHAGDEHSSVTSGVYYHNPTETYVDVLRRADGAHTRWMSESGAVDIFLLPGPTPAATTRQYTALTGTTRMPPAFSLGYHQCRWNYRDEADVAAVDAGSTRTTCRTTLCGWTSNTPTETVHDVGRERVSHAEAHDRGRGEPRQEDGGHRRPARQEGSEVSDSPRGGVAGTTSRIPTGRISTGGAGRDPPRTSTSSRPSCGTGGRENSRSTRTRGPPATCTSGTT